MRDIEKTVEALKEAEKYLDQHISDPKHYNDYMSSFLEIIAMDIRIKINSLQENCF